MINKLIKGINIARMTDLFKEIFSRSKGYRMKILYITILRTINSLISIFIALISKDIIDSAVAKDLSKVYQLAGILVLILILKLILSRYSSIYSTKFSASIYNDFQYRTLRTIYTSQWLEISKFKTGDLLTRVGNDVSKFVSIYTSIIPRVISMTIKLIVAFITLSYYDNVIALIAFVIAPLTMALSWFVGLKLKKIQSDIQKSVSELNSYITETLQNNDLIKTYNLTDSSSKKLNKLQDHRKELVLRKSIFSAVSKGLINFGFTIGFLGATILGAYKLYLGSISFGTFTAFLQLVNYIQSPMMGLAGKLSSTLTAMSSIERILEIENYIEDQFENTPDQLIDAIEFKNVSFSYGTCEVLKDINLTIQNNRNVAFLGQSGSGKTTILRMLTALIEPEGTINLHSQTHQSKLNQSSRKYFSYIPQSNILFSGSIRDNLRLDNETLTDDDIMTVLKVTEMYEYINSLDHKLDTLVGERSSGLSEGQAQRLCISRALLRNSQFLILDEATSALDMKLEQRLINNIINQTDKTLIVVTHRQEILKYCDDVYEITNKEITKLS